MSLPSTAEIPALQPPPLPWVGPWKFWGTTLWCLAAVAAFFAVSVGGCVALLLWLGVATLSEAEMTDLIVKEHAPLLFAIISAGVIAATGVLALAIRLSHLGVKNYLGLFWAKTFYVKAGFAGLAVLYVIFAAANYFFWPKAGEPIVQMYNEASASGTILGLVFLVVIVAPLVEEFLIRGFLLRGWGASRIGPTLAIILTTLVWTALHTQYGLPMLANVFCIGLLFGWLRYRSGSLLLPIVLHATQNGTSLAIIGLFAWLGHGTATT